MKKLYCVICSKYWKFENPKTSYRLEEIFDLSIICSKRNKNEKLFKKEKSIEILEIFGLIENI